MFSYELFSILRFDRRTSCYVQAIKQHPTWLGLLLMARYNFRITGLAFNQSHYSTTEPSSSDLIIKISKFKKNKGYFTLYEDFYFSFKIYFG